jgi:hypothetical protein
MGKRKRKLTSAEKTEKKRRQRKYMTIFVNGKQKRVKRPPTVDGIPVDEFIRNNADPIWLIQNEMYEELHQWEQERDAEEQEDSQPEALERDFGNRAARFPKSRSRAAVRLEEKQTIDTFCGIGIMPIYDL